MPENYLGEVCNNFQVLNLFAMILVQVYFRNIAKINLNESNTQPTFACSKLTMEIPD